MPASKKIAQSKKEPRTTVPRNTNPIPVKIKYDPDDKCLGKIKPVTLDLAKKEEIVWSSKNARVEITFDPKEFPFLVGRYRVARGGSIHSGIPVTDRAQEKTYTYTVTVVAVSDPKTQTPKRCPNVKMVAPVKPNKPLPSTIGEIRVKLAPVPEPPPPPKGQVKKK